MGQFVDKTYVCGFQFQDLNNKNVVLFVSEGEAFMENTTKRCPFRENLDSKEDVWPKCLLSDCPYYDAFFGMCIKVWTRSRRNKCQEYYDRRT